jgi:hypothetical protein
MNDLNNLDLNINNYSKNDMLNFFKVSNDFSKAELEKKENELTLAIMSPQQSFDTNHRFKLLNFIRTMKDVLISKIASSYTVEDFDEPIIKIKEMNPPRIPIPSEFPNNVGRIINPESNHPSIQNMSIPSKSINGYNTNIRVTNYVFNTKFRDDFFNTVAVNSTFTFPTVKNVLTMALNALQFPNNLLAFSLSNRTTKIFIRNEITNDEAVVTIPDGNYDPQEFPHILEKAINEALTGSYDPEGSNQFSVSIDPYTFSTTISNSLYQFTMKMIIDYGTDVAANCEEFNLYARRFRTTDIDPNTGQQSGNFTNSLGFQIGFREAEYYGKKSYSSEGCFDNTYSDYIYLAVNEFANVNYFENTIGILPSSLINKNLLGIIPIRSPTFTSTFDNSADNIYKTRSYLAPVDINKVNVQLLGTNGKLINNKRSEYSFVLQMTTLFDNTIPYTSNAVSVY